MQQQVQQFKLHRRLGSSLSPLFICALVSHSHTIHATDRLSCADCPSRSFFLRSLGTFLFLSYTVAPPFSFFFFFLNDPAPPEIYPLPLHDALPICGPLGGPSGRGRPSSPRRCTAGPAVRARWRSSR